MERSSNMRGIIPTELAKLLVSFESIVDTLSAKTADLEEDSSKLSEAQKIAKLGNWELRGGAKAMWCSDEMYSILNLNKIPNEIGGAEELISYTYSDFLGKFSDADRTLLQQKIESSVSVESSFTLEHCLQLKGTKASHFKHDVILTNVLNSEEKIIVGTLQDIS
ncbi:MAG: hypothetical protein ACJA0Z_004233 [Halioglobus sp.]|jgi:hypothetical protein